MQGACAVADSKKMKVARFGDNMRQVAVTDGNKVSAQMKFGYEVNGYGVGDLVKYIDGISDAQINTLIKEYEALYVMAAKIMLGRRDQGPPFGMLQK